MKIRKLCEPLFMAAALSIPAAALASGPDTDWRQMGFSAKGDRFNKHETVLNAGNVAGLSVAWSAETGDVIRSSPASANGIVYAGSWDGKLYALDEATGAVKWVADAPGIRNSSPAIADGRVFVASYYGVLYAFQIADGKPAWTAKLGRYEGASPTVANDTVYVTSAGKLYAFDAKSGALKWRVRTGGTQSPAVANGVVYVGGKGTLRGLDAATGAVIWRREAPVISAPAYSNGALYAVYLMPTNEYGVYAAEAATGKELWHSPFGGFSQSGVAVANGLVYAGSFDGNLYTFDAKTGASKWNFNAGTEIDDTPAVANGVVYVASTEDGVLYALDAASGSSLWSAPATNTFMFSPPSVVNGRVFVGSDNHKLYSFALDGGNRAGGINSR
ncbi:MAG TPA: PQQ-binding-like beta-propeller repeat protein [Rhizomicrobium sp.]|jgi:outer membrane protein assembly factor BamB